ncbi:MAG TPA: hypothetical protein VK915_09170 [Gaiellaceae bacterium]|nr:hypothetical protein [Gaiellaceae bacterium]
MPDELNRMNIARGAKPVVSNARLGQMTAEEPAPKAIGGKTLLMAARPAADTGKTKRMAPFAKASVVRQAKKRPDMEKPKTRATARKADGYVRMRVRVVDGKMSVLDAKAVEGPLVESKLQGAVAYEVLLGDRRVAAGAAPDVGERRSFPDPKARTPEMRGHHVTPLRSYEVNVRVPKAEVSVAELPTLEVALYRIKEEIPAERAAPSALAAGAVGPQFQRELREIGRLKGIDPAKLEKGVAAQLRKAFK